nr:hypothetical protein [Tanacetum cinerariifolium]
MYHGEMLHCTNLKNDSPDSKKTLEDAEESRLKMRNKMVQLNYGKLNALYKTFVPQQEPYVIFRVESSNSVRRPKSKDTKSKNRVLKNTNDKSSSAHVQKMVKRALSTTPVATKSMNIGATSVVVKSRLSASKTPKATNKVIQLVLWIVDSGCSKHMTEYYATSSTEVPDISATNTLDNDDTFSSSSIIIEEDETPQIVSLSAKPVATEPNTLVLNENANELVQEDVAKLDGNVFYNPLQILKSKKLSHL